MLWRKFPYLIGLCTLGRRGDHCSKERIKEHVADVRHRRAKQVGEHFSTDGHSKRNMGVTVLEKMVGDTTGRLRSKMDREVKNRSATWVK